MIKRIIHYLLCIVTLLLVMLLWSSSLLLFVSLLVVSVFSLSLYGSKKEVSLFIIVGLLGALAEVFGVLAGAWSYAGTAFIPLWLPLVWGIASLFVVRVYYDLK